MLHLPSFTLRGCWLAVAVALTITLTCLVGCDEEDAACIVTAVDPFYTPQDLGTDGALTGTWRYDEEVIFVFTPTENSAYDVVVEEQESAKHLSSHFEGHLFRLGPDLFLDLYPTVVPEGSEFYLLHFFRCHTAMKVDFPGDQLELKFVSPHWLAAQIEAGTVTIAHARSDEILLLTATTQEMQELLYRNANDDNAFGDSLLFDRVREEEEE